MLIFLWVIGFSYILILSIQHPSNHLYDFLAFAATSEGIGSTALAFSSLHKNYDQLYYDFARKIVSSCFKDNEEAKMSLNNYKTELSDPLMIRNKEDYEESLKDFCNSCFSQTPINKSPKSP